MMLLCCVAMILIAFFALNRDGTSAFVWIVVSACVVGHIVMMFFGHRHGERCDDKNERETGNDIRQENKDAEAKRHNNHGGCCGE